MPALSVDLLVRGQNLYVVGFASGIVKLYGSQSGVKVCELAAHSRQINALACHPAKSIFVTVGDDTFLNVWEVESGAAFNIRLVMSSRVPDFLLTGVCFANQNYNSILATVYNFKTVIVWDDVV